MKVTKRCLITSLINKCLNSFQKSPKIFNIYLSHVLNVQKMNYYQMYIMYCSKPVIYKRHRVEVEDWCATTVSEFCVAPGFHYIPSTGDHALFVLLVRSFESSWQECIETSWSKWSMGSWPSAHCDGLNAHKPKKPYLLWKLYRL